MHWFGEILLWKMPAGFQQHLLHTHLDNVIFYLYSSFTVNKSLQFCVHCPYTATRGSIVPSWACHR